MCEIALIRRSLLAQNAANVIQRPGCGRTLWESLQRSADSLAGLRGHLVYHIRALASQSAVKCGLKNATNVLDMTVPGPTA